MYGNTDTVDRFLSEGTTFSALPLPTYARCPAMVPYTNAGYQTASLTNTNLGCRQSYITPAVVDPYCGGRPQTYLPRPMARQGLAALGGSGMQQQQLDFTGVTSSHDNNENSCGYRCNAYQASGVINDVISCITPCEDYLRAIKSGQTPPPAGPARIACNSFRTDLLCAAQCANEKNPDECMRTCVGCVGRSVEEANYQRYLDIAGNCSFSNNTDEGQRTCILQKLGLQVTPGSAPTPAPSPGQSPYAPAPQPSPYAPAPPASRPYAPQAGTTPADCTQSLTWSQWTQALPTRA